MIDDIVEGLTDITNKYLGGIMPFVEKYWLYLLIIPALPIIYLIAHWLKIL
jgi:hypothetical protein